MAIKHPTIKAPGEKVFAVADWNADHTGTAVPDTHGNEAHSSAFITCAGVPACETDPVFGGWIAGPPNVSEFTNDAGYITSWGPETDPVFSAWQATYNAHAHGAGDPTQVSHSNLTNLNADDHPQYLKLTGGTMSGNLLFLSGAYLDHTTTIGAGTNDLKIYAPDYIDVKAGYQLNLGGSAAVNGVGAIGISAAAPSYSILMLNTGSTFNYDGLNYDFSINSDGLSPIFWVDASADAMYLYGHATFGTNRQLYFRDANSYIYSPSANVLHLYSPTIEFGGDGLFMQSKKLYFDVGTATGTEYIYSANDGYLDLSAFSGVRVNSLLTVAGSATVTGDIATAAGNVQGEKLIEDSRGQFFAYRTDLFDMAAVNTWYDLPWNVAAGVKVGFTHDAAGANPEQITVTYDGTYLITWNINSKYSSAHHVVTRLLDDGTEIAGSYFGGYGFAANYGGSMSPTVIAKIAAGSVIEVQVGTDLAGADINYQDSASLPDPTTFVCATISITKLSNDT